MRTRAENLEIAHQVIKDIRAQLTFGSNAALDENIADHKRVFALRALITLAGVMNAAVYKNNADFPVIAKLSTLAIKKYGYAQCGEQSQAAFYELMQKNIYPIDLCMTTEGMHNLMVIGRRPDANLDDISTWGDEAVVCDVWRGEAYPLSEFPNKQKLTNEGEYAAMTYETDTKPIHYLAGKLVVNQTIQTEQDLKNAQAKIKIDSNVERLFEKKTQNDRDLKNDLKLIITRYDRLVGALHQFKTSIIHQITFIKSNLESLTEELNKNPAKTQRSGFFVK